MFSVIYDPIYIFLIYGRSFFFSWKVRYLNEITFLRLQTKIKRKHQNVLLQSKWWNPTKKLWKRFFPAMLYFIIVISLSFLLFLYLYYIFMFDTYFTEKIYITLFFYFFLLLCYIIIAVGTSLVVQFFSYCALSCSRNVV